MNKHPGIPLLAAVLAAACFGASAADPDISGVWVARSALKHPSRLFYIASSKALGYAKGHETSQFGSFDVWGKFIYGDPQKRAEGVVSEEWIALHLDCAKQTYAPYRYMEFDEAGKTLVDTPTDGKVRHIITDWGDSVDLPLVALTAFVAHGDVCGFDSE